MNNHKLTFHSITTVVSDDTLTDYEVENRQDDRLASLTFYSRLKFNITVRYIFYLHTTVLQNHNSILLQGKKVVEIIFLLI